MLNKKTRNRFAAGLTRVLIPGEDPALSGDN
jgi:hypothetical protein